MASSNVFPTRIPKENNDLWYIWMKALSCTPDTRELIKDGFIEPSIEKKNTNGYKKVLKNHNIPRPWWAIFEIVILLNTSKKTWDIQDCYFVEDIKEDMG